MDLYTEILEIPHLARTCFEKNKGLVLPEKIPYIGMGSSYYAAISLRYQGVKIYPELASEYFNYLEKTKQFERAVLISQSGMSSETLWCADRFEQFVSITNDTASSLAKHPKTDFVVDVGAGVEIFSSTKTFINTLVVLYTGLGISPQPAFDVLNEKFSSLIAEGEMLGRKLYRLSKRSRYKGFFIIGSGPNLGTALQAALVMTESTKIPFTGMSLSQYDHGPKESAAKSVVVFINPDGKQNERVQKLRQKIEQVGAACFEINENRLPEKLSPFTVSIPLFVAAAWMARRQRISNPFEIGSKVTRVTS
ncbi:SIS domain-containing protein [Sunxiuqinia sp. A32]|uniref:SIS domain-containing protein n=1 Tax=Sunxiuqinia sp. A32 TaxID=3461496 RepID=UPI004045A92D